MQTVDAMVVADNKKVKVGQKGFFGGGEEPSGCEIV